jgi:two-component system cell cycle response regulator
MQAAELGFGECPGASRKPYGGLVGAVEWGFCRGKTVKILIADDDRISRRLLEKTLEREGYEVVAVDNGRLALEQLSLPDGPRLALLDWMMPGMDGPGVCAEIREQTGRRYIHLVLVTSRGSKQDIVAGLEAGADDYLTKPWDPAELTARLRVGQRILQLEDRLVEARETMRFKASHDPLTSLFNRGVIVDLLGRELSRTSRENRSTVVMLGDLDQFKNVNDTYGHAVGDEVLRETAKRLLASVRSYDLVGRYGGEEFLIVLNNCDSSQAVLRAEEVRNGIASHPVQTKRGPLPITMSLGVLASGDWNLHLVEEVLSEADSALYQAKTDGRNCVRVARPTPQRDTPQKLIQ